MPFRPLGRGGVMSWVVPDLIVYVFVTAVPPSLPAEAVTLTVAAPVGAVRERVEPLLLLSADDARVPTGSVAGMNAVSCPAPLPRTTRTAATTGTDWSVGLSTNARTPDRAQRLAEEQRCEG